MEIYSYLSNSRAPRLAKNAERYRVGMALKVFLCSLARTRIVQ